MSCIATLHKPALHGNVDVAQLFASELSSSPKFPGSVIVEEAGFNLGDGADHRLFAHRVDSSTLHFASSLELARLGFLGQVDALLNAFAGGGLLDSNEVAGLQTTRATAPFDVTTFQTYSDYANQVVVQPSFQSGGFSQLVQRMHNAGHRGRPRALRGAGDARVGAALCRHAGRALLPGPRSLIAAPARAGWQ